MKIIKESTNDYWFEIRPSKDNGTYFRLVAPNGEVFGGNTETYTQKHNAVSAIESMQEHVAGAGIVDFTVKNTPETSL